MRGCFTILVLAIAFIFGAAWLGAPVLAAAVVEQSLAASGIVTTQRTITVSADPPLELLVGHADRVVIDASGVHLRDLDADTMDLTLSNVDLVARQFGRVDGQLGGVLLTTTNGDAIAVESIAVRGRADAATATISIAEPVLEELVRDAIRRQSGLQVTAFSLVAPDRIRLTAGLTFDGRFVIAPNGSLVIEPASGGANAFQLFDSPAAVRLTSARVSGSQLVVTGMTNLEELRLTGPD